MEKQTGKGCVILFWRCRKNLIASRRYGMKVWQSYLENKTSGAMRMYWVYGPDQKDITIIGLEPHSEDKKMVHTTEFHCQICRIKLNMEF